MEERVVRDGEGESCEGRWERDERDGGEEL